MTSFLAWKKNEEQRAEEQIEERGYSNIKTDDISDAEIDSIFDTLK